MFKPKDIDVLILCGGLGKRLRSVVNDRPKPMAEINQQPFLDVLIGYLRAQGFRRFILSIGYMAVWMKKYYQQKKRGNIRLCEEKVALGTGGAVKRARRLIKGRHFLALNGDSFCKVDFKKFLAFHDKKQGLVSIVVVENRQNKDCGNVELDSLNRVINFKEKCKGKNFLVSAGIYLFDRGIFSFMPKENRFFLEYDLFRKLNGEVFYGYKAHRTLIDIGTPEGLRRAQRYLKRPMAKK